MQQLFAKAFAAVCFVNPELFDFSHTRPGVTGDRTYLGSMCVDSGKTQPPAVVRSGGTAVMLVKPILEVIDIGDRQIMPHQYLGLRDAHVRPSVTATRQFILPE